MKRNGIRVVALAVLVGAATLALAMPATGHKLVYPTSLQLKIDTLSDTQDTFSGKVSSTRAACQSGRTVTITHAGVTIATATTDVAGNYTVAGPRPPKGDDVSAFTPKKVLKKNRRHTHRCARDVVTHNAP
jgi:hypothetical protein